MNYIIGLTGGIGSGKSTISNQFKLLGIPIIDSDIISKNIINNNLHIIKIIKKRFGELIINQNGIINKKKLRKIIFSKYEEKIWIETLLQPYITNEINHQIDTIKAPYIIRVSPLLLEKKLQHTVNHIAVIDITPEEQIKRIIKRDHITEQEVKNILNNQMERTSRLQKADEIIYSTNCMYEMKKNILTLHQHYLKLRNNKL